MQRRTLKVTDEKSVSQEEKHIQEIVDILREAGLKTQAEIYYFVREYCGRDCVKNGLDWLMQTEKI